MLRSIALAATIATTGAYTLGTAPGVMSRVSTVRMDGIINESIDKDSPKVQHHLRACKQLCSRLPIQHMQLLVLRR